MQGIARTSVVKMFRGSAAPMGVAVSSVRITAVHAASRSGRTWSVSFPMALCILQFGARDALLARWSRIMAGMAKKSAKKSKPKTRTAKAATAVAKKKSGGLAARAKKTTSPKKTARKVAKKAARKVAAKKSARKASKRPVVRAKTPKRAKRATPKRAKRATPKRAAAKKPVPPPFHRRDGAGHLDPKYAAELLAQSGGHDDDRGRAFLKTARSGDDLAEELGEGFVQSATSGEPGGEDTLDQIVDEETGGPFVVSTGGQEFAEGTDESNPASASREPFPKT